MLQTFGRVLRAIQAEKDAAGDIDWRVSVDSTIVRAHQHAAGGKRGAGDRDEAGDHALGRSRGGLSTKIHLACDGRGRPLGFVLTGGNTKDCTRFEQVMTEIHVPRTGPGRPGTTPDHVIADKGYSSRKIRTYRGIPRTIPERRAPAADRPASIGPSTASATSSNAASTASSNGVAWPPATPRPASPCRPLSPSPQSCSGSEP
ncbi:IS5 family transposase [Streptomyces sp. SID1046]|nr:IS5 family transposase [Streptomyces sp. SID1046]